MRSCALCPDSPILTEDERDPTRLVIYYCKEVGGKRAGATLLILPPYVEREDVWQIPTPNFASNSSVKDIQKRNHVRIGVVPEMPGFCERDKTGRLVGLDVEIAKLLSRAMFGGTKTSAVDVIDFVDISIHDRESVLEEDVVDFVVSVFAITPERRKRVDFSAPYFGTSLSVLMRSDEDPTDQTRMQSARIGVAEGSVGESFSKANALGSRVIEFESVAEIVDAVRDGVVDACVTTSLVLDNFANRDPEHLVKMPWTMTHLSHGIGVRKGNDQLRMFLNQQVEQFWDDGMLLRLASLFGPRGRANS